MNDLQIEAFLAVLKYNSYSKAAAEIYVPQPTITHRIQQLEEALGKELIYRNSRGITLTEAGKSFLPYARQIQEATMNAKMKVRDLDTGVAGRINIGVSYALSMYVFPQFLEHFTLEHPNVELSINTQASDLLMRVLQEKKIAIGLTRHFVSDADIMCEVIGEDPVLLVTSPEHEFVKRKEPVPIEEVLHEKIFNYHKGTFYRNMIEDALVSLGLVMYHPLEINNPELIKYMVKKNMGVSLLPELYVRDALKTGELVEIELDRNIFPKQKTFICYSRDYVDGVLATFIKSVKEYDWSGRKE